MHTSVSLARASGHRFRHKSRRLPANRCRSRSKRSQPTRSWLSTSGRRAEGERRGHRKRNGRVGSGRRRLGGAESLAGRTIVLGVTGGISAYKAVEVCRRLVDAGAHVAPVMTEGAQRFVGVTTFSALASEPVQTTLFDGVIRSRTRALARWPTLCWSARQQRASSVPLRCGDIRRSSDSNAAYGTERPSLVSCDAHRNVGAPSRTAEPGSPRRAWRHHRAARRWTSGGRR